MVRCSQQSPDSPGGPLQPFAERKAHGNIFRHEPLFPLPAGKQRFLAHFSTDFDEYRCVGLVLKRQRAWCDWIDAIDANSIL
jgi:hypothetical protein